MSETCLKIKVVDARNLASADSNGLSDPYIVIQVGSVKKKTKIVKKSLNPTYGEVFEFPLSPEDETIHVMAYDWDALSSDDFLGEALIPVNRVKADGIAYWYPLTDRTVNSARQNGLVVSGDVRLAIETAFVQSLGTDADGSDEKLSMVKMVPLIKQNVQSILYCLEPVLELRFTIVHLTLWSSKLTSLVFFLLLMWVLWHDLFLSALFLSIFGYLSMKYANKALSGNSAVEYVSFHSLTSKDLTDKVRELKDRTRIGKKTSISDDIRMVVRIMGKIGDVLNDIRSFENYEKGRAQTVLGSLAVAALLSAFFPVTQWIVFVLRWAALAGGVGLFVLKPMLKHYPALKNKSTRTLILTALLIPFSGPLRAIRRRYMQWRLARRRRGKSKGNELSTMDMATTLTHVDAIQRMNEDFQQRLAVATRAYPEGVAGVGGGGGGTASSVTSPSAARHKDSPAMPRMHSSGGVGDGVFGFESMTEVGGTSSHYELPGTEERARARFQCRLLRHDQGNTQPGGDAVRNSGAAQRKSRDSNGEDGAEVERVPQHDSAEEEVPEAQYDARELQDEHQPIGLRQVLKGTVFVTDHAFYFFPDLVTRKKKPQYLLLSSTLGS